MLSSVLPTEHKHTKDPWLFLHSPLIQGLDKHSSTSVGKRNKHQVWNISHLFFFFDTADTALAAQMENEPLTFADVCPWIKAVSFVTLTGETAWRVPAQTVFTKLPVYQALINIWGKAQTQRLVDFPHTSFSFEAFHFLRGDYRAVDLPMQLLPDRSTSNPSLQVHLYVLNIFSHTPFWQMSGSRAHSLISEKAKNSLLNITAEKKLKQ